MGRGIPFPKVCTLPVFSFFADIETFYRPVIAHYAGIHQTFASLCLILLQNQVMWLLLCIHCLLIVGK